MRHYEIMLLIHPDRSDQVSSMVQRYRESIQSSKGLIHRLEDLGRRTLAYPIKKLGKAYYTLLNIECTAETQQELKDSIAFNDSVLRCLSIRRTKAITEPSLLNRDPSKSSVVEASKEDTKSEGEKGEEKADNIPMRPAANPTKKRKYRALVEVKNADIDYKNVAFLEDCLTDTKKIARRRVTGANAKQQHKLREAIKRARLVGLLPHCDKYEQPEIN